MELDSSRPFFRWIPLWKRSLYSFQFPLLLTVLMTQGFAQSRPLKTESVQTVEKDHVRFELGFEFLQDVSFNFSGLKGDLSRVGVLGLRFGAGEKVEVQMFWTAANVLNIDERKNAPNSPNLEISGNSTGDIGNLILATKTRLISEGLGNPGLALRFGVELPNASNESGLGNDETDFFTSVLLEKKIGELRVIGNAGMAILGDPVSAGAQDDLFTYGLAVLYPASEAWTLVADVYGRAGPGGIGTEEQTLLRLGAQLEAAGLWWDISFLGGFQETDPCTGLVLGVSKDFRLPFFD